MRVRRVWIVRRREWVLPFPGGRWELHRLNFMGTLIYMHDPTQGMDTVITRLRYIWRKMRW